MTDPAFRGVSFQLEEEGFLMPENQLTEVVRPRPGKRVTIESSSNVYAQVTRSSKGIHF